MRPKSEAPNTSRRPMRRPSDLRREERTGTVRRRSVENRAALEWPREFAVTVEDRLALLVLLNLASMTARRLLELANEVRTAGRCLEEVRRGNAGSEADRAHARSICAEDVSKRLEAVGARLLAVHDPGYPAELFDLFDPPAGLFIMGSEHLSEAPDRVAIVGARNGSAGGKEMAGLLAQSLVRERIAVVSGGARGIDAAAHEGALKAGGAPTIAVLGSGIDIAYPAENRRLLDRIAKEGVILSEYPPGVPAEPFRFPARNRIVAAMARAIVVVEGAEGSGSRITAEHALDLGREVFAVPGAPWAPLSAVPLTLIRDGATLIRGPDDLLADLGVASTNGEGEQGHREGGGRPPVLATEDALVWGALAAPAPADSLAAELGVPIAKVLASLVRLELQGAVRQVGGRYERRPAGKANP